MLVDISTYLFTSLSSLLSSLLSSSLSPRCQPLSTSVNLCQLSLTFKFNVNQCRPCCQVQCQAQYQLHRPIAPNRARSRPFAPNRARCRPLAPYRAGRCSSAPNQMRCWLLGEVLILNEELTIVARLTQVDIG